MNSKQWLKLITVAAIALLIPRSARHVPHLAVPNNQTKEDSPTIKEVNQ